MIDLIVGEALRTRRRLVAQTGREWLNALGGASPWADEKLS
jgi:hypothetical protein